MRLGPWCKERRSALRWDDIVLQWTFWRRWDPRALPHKPDWLPADDPSVDRETI
jgi:hypothetical protein